MGFPTSWDKRVTIDLFLDRVGVGAFHLTVFATLYDSLREILFSLGKDIYEFSNG